MLSPPLSTRLGITAEATGLSRIRSLNNTTEWQLLAFAIKLAAIREVVGSALALP
jgi:hypothetical protein